MGWLFFAKGVVLGFAIAAPVGPIGVLCIRRTFADGRAAGLATGLGAATADALYGTVAAFGLTAVSGVLLGAAIWLRAMGGLFLLALGARTFVANPRGGAGGQATTLARAYATTVFLTLANPATILSFLAVFAGAGLGQARAGTAAAAAAMVAGVFAGSAAWWLILSGVVARWRERYPALRPSAGFGGAVMTGVALGAASTPLKRVNQASGIVLAGFGIAAVAAAMKG